MLFSDDRQIFLRPCVMHLSNIAVVRLQTQTSLNTLYSKTGYSSMANLVAMAVVYCKNLTAVVLSIIGIDLRGGAFLL